MEKLLPDSTRRFFFNQKRRQLYLLFFMFSVLHVSSTYAQEIIYPATASSRVIDVTKAPYNADSTGVNDATTAIQAALTAAGSGPNIIYLPNGTYKVSNRLNWGGTQKRDIMIGQSRDKTIIKLADNTPAYSNASSPKAIIWTGEAPAQRFSNGIRNLTVNTGSGNPGAIGIQFIANNQGGMENVLIKNDDDQGVYGLDLGYSDEQGPCLIKGIEVIGFNYGIRTKYGVDGVVLTNITLKNQKQYGLYNDGQCLSIENMTTYGSVPGLHNIGSGLVAIINSTFNGTGAAASVAAINNLNGLFARNITTTGFLKAINNQKGGNTTDATTINEFVSHEVEQLFTSPKKSLNLPVKQTPEIPMDPLSEWVNVGSFPAQTITLSNGKVVQDYTNALQQAIDAGKSTVYFGNGSGPFYGTVHVRGAVKRVLGMEAWMGDDVGADGTIIIEDGTAPEVLIEKFSSTYNEFNIIHNSSRTAIVKNMMIGDVTINSGAGDLFVDDIVAGGIVSIPAGGNLYARQFNLESLDDPKIRNYGNLWVLGIKTERDAAIVGSYTGSKTEIVGGFVYANKSTNANKVMFVNQEGSQFSATVGEFVIRNQPFNPVKETRDGVTKILKVGEAPSRGGGSMLPLYTGYRAIAAAPPTGAPTGLRGSSPRYDVTEISWTDNSDNEDGFLIERKVANGNYIPYNMGYANQTAFRDTLLSPLTTYTYRVKAVNSAGQSAFTDTLAITTLSPPATPAVPTNMTATIADANILVTWTDNSNNEDGFKLERRTITGTDTTAFTQLALLGANTTSYYQVGLAGSITYEYRIKAYKEISNSLYSNIASASLSAPTPLLVHWKMDELSGSTAGDASMHAQNGSLKGGLSFTNNSVSGKQGKALQLDGSDDYISGTDDGRYLPTEDYPFSMSAWFKTTDDGVLLHFGDKDRTDMYFTLSIIASGQSKLESCYGTTVLNVTGPMVKDGTWHLMTGVFQNTTTHKLYVDGALQATLTGSIPAHRYLTRFAAGAKEAVGSASSRLGAAIDDVRLYSKALSDAEVLALYSNTTPSTDATPPTAPTNLRASDTTDVSVKLTWTAATDSVGVTGYDIYNGATKVNTSAVSDTTYTVTGLTPSTAYSFTIKAKDAAGNLSAASNVVNVTTLVPSPNDLPVVSITSPANNATYAAPASVTISVNASDTDGTISKVEFFNGSTLLSTDTSAPYEFTWNNVVAGTYTITAKATDNKGATVTSSPITITSISYEYIVDNTDSGFSLVGTWTTSTGLAGYYGSNYLHDGDNVATPGKSAKWLSPVPTSGTYDVYMRWTSSADRPAAAPVQVNHSNGTATLTVNQRSNGSAWFKIGTWSFTAGDANYVSLSAENAGYTIADAVRWVKVNDPSADVTAPTAPTNLVASNSTETSVVLNWTASSDNVGVTGYDVYNGTTKINTVVITDITYTASGLTAGTAYNFSVKAKDAAGNASQASNVVNITTPSSNASPVVSITSPVSSASFTAPASVAISATASDSDGSISKVELYSGTTLLTTLTSAPYNWTWSNVAAGTYSLTAKATDNLGAVTTSTVVAITVNSSTPTTCGTVNIASGKTAVAKDYISASYQPKYAFDNNSTTRWASSSSIAHIRVDLGSIQPITCIKLDWAAAYASSYDILVSNDNVSYSVVWTTATGTGGVVDITGLNVSARHIKMQGKIEGHANQGYSINEFSIYGPGTMPVGFMNFNAAIQSNGVGLNWKTSSETNNSHFIISRSTDGNSFTPIGKIEGFGNTTDIKNYQFTDNNPLPGENYYSLTQVDKDGSSSVLSVKSINFSYSSSIKVFPNPATEYVNVSFPNGIYHTINVIDLNGKVLQNLTVNVSEGSKIVNLSGYPAGIYTLRFIKPGSSDYQKVIKQ